MDKQQSDQELVQAVLEKYHLKHKELAERLIVSRSAVTQWANGMTALRPPIRQKLESMLAERNQES